MRDRLLIAAAALLIVAGYVAESASAEGSRAATSSARNSFHVARLQSGSDGAVCTKQPDGLVAWYKGENNVRDETGNAAGEKGFNGTYGAGVVGSAFSFDGQGQLLYIDNGLNPENAAGSALSVAAWIKPESVAGRQVVISRYIFNQGRSWELAIEDGKVTFSVQQSETIKRSAVTVGTVILPGVFQHIVATFHLVDQGITFYVNGTVAASTIVDAGKLVSIRSFFTTDNVGARTDLQSTSVSDAFCGQIDELQVYNRRLAASDAASIYAAGSTGLCPNVERRGKIYTFGEVPLDDVPLTTPDGSKSIRTASDGSYTEKIEQGQFISYGPRLSTHVFAQPDVIVINSEDFGPNDFQSYLFSDDLFDAAILEGDAGEVEGINMGATRENGEPNHAGAISVNSVWYRWHAPRSGSYTFTLGGSRFNTLLAVYTGTSVSSLTKVAENDDVAPAAFSRLSFNAVAGTEYLIAVDGRIGWAGAGHFRLAYYPDDFAPGYKISGRVTTSGGVVAGASILAQTATGRVVSSAIADSQGRYSLVLPLGVVSFRLTVRGQEEKTLLGYAEFAGITQDQTVDFTKPAKGAPGYVLINSITGLASTAGLTVTYRGPSVVGEVPCAVSSNPTLVTFTCAGITPYSTFTVTPRHPTASFVPPSKTINNISANVLGGSFLANTGAGYRISGRVTKDGGTLSGASVLLEMNGALINTAIADPAGDYAFDNLPSGHAFNVRASMPGYQFSQTYQFSGLLGDQVANFAAVSNCEYSLSSALQRFPADGGYGFVSMKTANKCAWETTTTSPGINLSSSLASEGNGGISYYVSPNTGAARVGYLFAGGKAVRIEQTGRSVLNAFDFDGDARADFTVRRPSDNTWYMLRTSAGYTAMQFGVAGDLAAPADYDGDGRTDVAVFRPSTGQWFIAGSTAGFYVFNWGASGDLPVPADYDGDGKADIAVYRPSNGTWYRKLSSGDQISNIQFGSPEDRPQPGDYDGDGRADLAVRRPSNNTWYFLRTTAGFTAFAWGENGDAATPADFDGDGRTDVAVFRPSTGQWFVAGSSSGFFLKNWGASGDTAAPADYDGDGKADVAVFRPSNNTWYVQGSNFGMVQLNFGASGDVPIPSLFGY
jgi:hypothetical protein